MIMFMSVADWERSIEFTQRDKVIFPVDAPQTLTNNCTQLTTVAKQFPVSLLT